MAVFNIIESIFFNIKTVNNYTPELPIKYLFSYTNFNFYCRKKCVIILLKLMTKLHLNIIIYYKHKNEIN